MRKEARGFTLVEAMVAMAVVAVVAGVAIPSWQAARASAHASAARTEML